MILEHSRPLHHDSKDHLKHHKSFCLEYNQEDIEISWEVFSKDEDKYTVKWSLEYTDKNNITKLLKGAYLIKLNSDNECDYFFHCGESKN